MYLSHIFSILNPVPTFLVNVLACTSTSMLTGCTKQDQQNLHSRAKCNFPFGNYVFSNLRRPPSPLNNVGAELVFQLSGIRTNTIFRNHLSCSLLLPEFKPRLNFV